MSIRLTGISTPFGGATWEYKNEKTGNPKDSLSPVIKPHTKLKVFISSNYGEKYESFLARSMTDS